MTERTQRPRHNANGEGSVYRRKSDGRYVAAITVEGRKIVGYGKTSAEANAKLRALLGARERGEPVQPDRQPLGPYLEAWLVDRSPRLSVQTRQRYASVIRHHLGPALGAVPLGHLRPQRIQALYRQMQEAGKGRSLIGTAQTVLSQALDRAERWGQIPRNPAKLVELPRGEHRQGVSLTLAEARRFLAAARDDPQWAYFLMAITTGLRPGELAALRWANVDLERGVAAVAATRVRDGGLRIQEYTKTRRVRVVPLLPEAVTALRQHRASQAERRLALGPAWSDLDLVFPGEHGRVVESRAMDLALRRLLTAADLPRIRPHDLRHSTASLLIALGVDPVTVARILGHSRPSLTLDRYSHPFDATIRSAVDTLGQALQGGAG